MVHDREAVSDGRALEAELAEAQARLREAGHRIRNDLQLISSVFVLQMRQLPDGPERGLMAGAVARVAAVAAVHRRLDVGGDFGRLDAAGLIHDLAREATARRADVEVALELMPLVLAARQAGPLALIANELIRNGVTHAFPDRGGLIEVSLWSADGSVGFSVRDNGVGPQRDSGPPHGFGVTLAGILAKQLRGELEFGAAHPGLRAVVRFPEAA